MKPVAAAVSTGGGGWDPTESIRNVLDGVPGQPPAEPPTPEPPAVPAEPPAPAAPPAVTRDEPAADVSPDLLTSAVPEGLIPGAAKPVTPVAPVSAAPADDDEPDPEEIVRGSAKGKNAWSKIKAEKKQLSQKAKELEQKLKDAEARLSTADQAKPPEMQQLLELQKQVAEYEDRIGQLDITQSREFKTRYDYPIERSIKRGEAILQRAGLQQADASALMGKLLDADAATVSELIADQPLPVQGSLFSLVTDVAEMRSDRESAVKNWRETRPALKEAETRNNEIVLAQNIENDTSEAVQQALKEGNFMYTRGDHMPADWNAAVDERILMIKGILRTSKAPEMVKWVAEGVTAKDLREMLAKEHARANQLAQELNARANLRPRLSGRDSSVPAPAGRSIQPMTPESVVGGLFK